MKDFIRHWLRNMHEWLACITIATVAFAIILTVSHALAWVARTYGGTVLLTVVVVLCGLVVVGGSAVQTYRQRKGPAGSP